MAITDLSATARSSTTVRLEFTKEAGGFGNEFRFRVSGGSWGQWFSGSASNIGGDRRRYDITTLSPSTSYDFQVRTIFINPTRRGDSSNTASATTQAGAVQAPLTPGAPSVTTTHNTITVTWSTVARATEFDLQWRVGNSGDWTTVSNVSSGYQITGRAAETLHQVRIRAGNSGGDSNWSSARNATTMAVPVASPGNVTNISATVVDHDSITIAWRQGTGGAPSSYSIRHRQSGSSTWTTITNIMTTSRTINGLASSTTHEFQIQAVNASGSSNWRPTNPITGTTQAQPTDPPGDIENFTGRYNATTHQIELDWDDATDATSYSVWRVDVAIGGALSEIGTPTDSSYNDANIERGKTYRYDVRGDNSAGFGRYFGVSEGVAARPTVMVPELVADKFSTTVTAGNGQVVIRWNRARDNTRRFYSRYMVYRSESANSGFEEIHRVSYNNQASFSFTDTQVIIGRTYYYYVEGFLGGFDDQGNILSAIPTGTATPGVPRNPAATTIDTDSIEITWEEPVAGGEISEYQIQYREKGTSSYTLIEDILSTDRSEQIDGLDAGTTYEIQVNATNTNGSSAWVSANDVTTRTANAAKNILRLTSTGTLGAPDGFTTHSSAAHIWNAEFKVNNLTLYQDTAANKSQSISPTHTLEAVCSIGNDLSLTMIFQLSDIPFIDETKLVGGVSVIGSNGSPAARFRRPRLFTIGAWGYQGAWTEAYHYSYRSGAGLVSMTVSISGGVMTIKIFDFFSNESGNNNFLHGVFDVENNPPEPPLSWIQLSYDGDIAAATTPHRPAAPSVATVSDTSLRATWERARTGGAPTGYDLRHSTDQRTWTVVADVSSPRTIFNLISNTTYYIQIRAKNSAGSSNWSPSGSGVTDTSINGILRFGTDGELSKNNGFTTHTTSAHVWDATLTINSLTLYKSAVATQTRQVSPTHGLAVECSIGSDLSLTMEIAPGNIPTIDDNLLLDIVGTIGTIEAPRVRFKKPILYSIGAWGYQANWTEVTLSSTNVTISNNKTLTIKIPNFFDNQSANNNFLHAVFDVENNPPEPPFSWYQLAYSGSFVEAGVPNRPAAPTVVAVDHARIRATWAAPTGGPAATGYDLQYSTDQRNWQEVEDVTSSYIISMLTASTLYYVQVRAKNDAGEGEWSPSGSDTTLAAPPLDVQIDQPDENRVWGSSLIRVVAEVTATNMDSLEYEWSQTGGLNLRTQNATNEMLCQIPAGTNVSQSASLTLTVTDTVLDIKANHTISLSIVPEPNISLLFNINNLIPEIPGMVSFASVCRREYASGVALIDGRYQESRTDSLINANFVQSTPAYVTLLDLANNGVMRLYLGPTNNPSDRGLPANPQFTSAARQDIGLAWMLPNGETFAYDMNDLTSSDSTEPYGFSAAAVANAGPTNDGVLRNKIKDFYNARVIFVDKTNPQIDWPNLRLQGGPARPTGLSAFSSDGAIHLTWIDPVIPSISGYEYLLINNETGRARPWELVPGSNFATTEYTIYGLTNGSSYTIHIRAFNAAGTSPQSDSVHATPDSDWKTIWGGLLDEFDFDDVKSGRDLLNVSAVGALIYLNQNNDVSTSLQRDENGAENFWVLLQAAFVPNDLIGNLTANHDLLWWWVNNQNGLSSGVAIEKTEGGRLYENRQGNITLDGADTIQHRFNDDPVAYFSDDLSPDTFHVNKTEVIQTSKELRNEVRIPIRQFSTSVEAVLWQLNEPITIPPNSYLRLEAPHDLGGVGAWTTPLLADEDYTANTAADDSGVDLTSNLSLSLIEYGQKLIIDMFNTSNQVMWVTKLQARGRALNENNQYSLLLPNAEENALNEAARASIQKFGKRPLPLSESFFTDLDHARTVADYLLHTSLNPQDRILFSFYLGLYLQLGSELEIGDLISLKRRGTTQLYIVENIAHSWLPGPHIVTCELLPVAEEVGDVWILDEGPPLGQARLSR